MAGIQSPTNDSGPLDVVRSLAQLGATQRGSSLLDLGLRLYEDASTVEAFDRDDLEVDTDDRVSPFALGRTYELLLTPSDRRKAGAHLTPEAVARQLIGLMDTPQASDHVLDPSVGGGSFLLAAADQLVAAGAGPSEVVGQLHGFDIDPGAVAVAEAALALWALDHGTTPVPLPGLLVGDGLLLDLPSVQRVVGNPPFLNQLRTSSSHTTRRRSALKARWGDWVGAYTDDAWLFLAAGLDALTPGGSIAMVQPMSILAARHGHKVREHFATASTMQALWVARDRVFEAAVQVCGLIFTNGHVGSAAVKRFVGAEFEPRVSLDAQPAPTSWGAAASIALDVPQVVVRRSVDPATVADLATATAGFRDQFYGLVPYVSELADQAAWDSITSMSPLVTVGMIEVLKLEWGQRSFKFAGDSYIRPTVDVASLREGDQRLGEWVDARLRPKMLMATQTRVVELWVDVLGTAVPATPVLSIEPHDEEDVDALWRVAAALSSPAMSAHFVATHFGTALSLNAMKLAARDVLAAPLPSQVAPWHDAAKLLAMGDVDLQTFGSLMNEAYEVTEPAVMPWWLARLPKRSSGSA